MLVAVELCVSPQATLLKGEKMNVASGLENQEYGRRDLSR
jgi:hypothetical protein